jgi:hypothetical protein
MCVAPGEFFLSKAKPLLVNTLRGVPFNQCEHSGPSRTSINEKLPIVSFIEYIYST